MAHHSVLEAHDSCAGVAHLTAIVLASTRIYQLRSGALHPTYRLKGLSRQAHLLASTLQACHTLDDSQLPVHA